VHRFCTWAHWSPFLNLQKIQISKLYKIQKIPRHSQLYILRSCKFIIRNTLYSVFGKKNQKSVSFFSSKNLFNLSFILSLRNKVFHIENLHGHSVYSWLHPSVSLFLFWSFEIWNFLYLKNRAPGSPGANSIYRATDPQLTPCSASFSPIFVYKS
jgi:hypothetical protein